jgi:tetratricopeptide (TPR) repeat protein
MAAALCAFRASSAAKTTSRGRYLAVQPIVIIRSFVIRSADLRLGAVLRLAALCAAGASVPFAGVTQAQDVSGRAVVQPLPDPAAQRLNHALRMLAQDPNSLTGLLEAGQASLALDDVEAALGFFRRAEAVFPAHGGVKAGLASVLARQGQPIEALRLFAEAEVTGEPMVPHSADRGLAYDLVGDNVRAQQEYRLALALGEDPAVSRRLAISQAIAGNQPASEATLLPMLQRSDLAAFRARAFSLAILGKTEEAVSIAETMLPQSISSRLAPYLRYMPRLTRAQQAAAANIGAFPPAAQIGRDDPALAGFSSQSGPPQRAQAADARLVPSGEPLGRREGTIPRREIAGQAAVSSPIQQSDPPVASAAIDPPAATPADVAPAAQQPQAVVVAQLPPAVVEDDPRPSFSIAARPAPPPSDAPEAISLSEAFADFTLPVARSIPAPGAVDITAIQPSREVARAEPAARPTPPPPPAHPSRQWVQVATGRDTAALAFDWRRIRRNAAGLLDGHKPHVARWGQTNRLVAGPFASAAEAQEFVGKLKEKQIDSFRFASAQGEEVRALD